jgi:hypothetical protein
LNTSELGKMLEVPAHKGLRMGGTYRGENGISISFTAESAAIAGCGKLIASGRGYTVSVGRDSVRIAVSNQPKQLAFELGASGRIAGPSGADVTGQVITGYRLYNVWRRYADGTIVPGSQHQESEPVYEDRTVRCSFSSLQPVGTTQSDASPLALISSLFGGEKSQEMKEDEKHPTPPGLRMAGIYSGAGGLRMEFHPVAVILDCGEAHVARAYNVQQAADGVHVTVANDTSPFTMTVRGDGGLAGSGLAEVAGRLLAGQTENGFVFRPHRESCALNSLALE